MGVQFLEMIGWVKKRKVFALLLISLTLGIGIVIGTVISGHALATHDQTASNGASLLAIPEPITLSNAFTGISRKVGPAVVNISTTQVIDKPKGNKKPRHFNDPFQDFFDRYFDSPDDGPSAERSLGSGVIVDKKGFILTNNHVIAEATKIQVAMDADPTKYSAKVIGTDDETDLAVIKIEANRDLPVAKLGNSDGTQVGDWVLAFGSPFGLNSTVTAGIISAKDRTTVNNKQFQRFIQTDAAINPGNSGGALVNMAGEVIGINTAIYTGSRGFEGVGFALPSNTAISVYNQLITAGKVTRGSIGITFQEERSNNPVLMKELGAPYGIVVEAIEPGSPADKAGLQPGDVITDINSRAIHTGADLVNPIAQTPIGQSVELRYVRNKQTKDVTLTVADRSKIFPQTAQNSEERPDKSEEPSRLGLHVEELTPDLTQKLGMGKLSGVVVSEVEPASFAEDVEFERGDVITEINHAPVNSLADYRREMGQLKPGQDVLFKVARRGANDRVLTLFLAGAVPREK